MWLSFPWKYGRISTQSFLRHIEEHKDKILFDYGGMPLELVAVKFVDPFVDNSGERNIFSYATWKATGFSTGWNDELQAWSQA